jgi:hypothetical protein
LSFDGSGDYVEVSKSSSLNPTSITLMAWFKANAFLSGENPLLDRNNYYAFGLYNGQLWSWLNLPTPPRYATSVETGKWHHFMVTFGNGIRKHYLNGQLVNSWQEAANELTVYDTIRMIIGANSNDTPTTKNLPNRFFNGLIDEVRIYEEALTTSQIQQLYAQGLKQLLAKSLISRDEYNQRMAELKKIKP